LFKNQINLLGLFVLLFVFTACGGGGGDSEQPSSEPVSLNANFININSSIELILNGQSLLSRSDDDSFTIEVDSLAVGDSYEFTYTSSDNQLCSIDAPSGVVGSNQELSISVSCVVWTFNVNIQGVDSSIDVLINGEQLINTGSDLNTVLELNDFRDGDTFNFTYQSLENQFCSLVGAQGAVLESSPENTLEVNCFTWQGPADIDDHFPQEGNASDSPVVAINNNGNALVVWRQNLFNSNSTFSFQIFIRERINGVWSDVFISDAVSPTTPTQNTFNPSVALNDNGAAVVAWEQSDGSNSQIFTAYRKDLNASWILPDDLNDSVSNPGSNALNPSAAMNENDEAFVVWEQSDGFDSRIHRVLVREFFPPPSEIISVSGSDAINPRVSHNSSGDGVVVWEQSDGSNSQIFRSERVSGGSWTIPASLADNISFDGEAATQAQVSVSESGDALIVWEQSDGSNSQIFKSEKRGGSWVNPSSLTDNISLDGQSATSADVSMNDDGEAVIAWSQSDGSNTQIFSLLYQTGAWSSHTDLQDNHSPNGTNAVSPKVSIGDDVNVIVTWLQLNNSSLDQVYKSQHYNNTWINPLDLDDFLSLADSGVIYNELSMNNSGQILSVWGQFNGVYSQVYLGEHAVVHAPYFSPFSL